MSDPDLSPPRLRLPEGSRPGSAHFAQHQLTVEVKAFIVEARAGTAQPPQPLPPPAGHEQWPRHHPARKVLAWPVITDRGTLFHDWLDTEGRWWRLRYVPPADLADAFPIGSPVAVASDLARYTNAMRGLLDRP